MEKSNWSIDLVKKEAEKYTTKIDFRNNSYSAYSWAHRNNIIQDICSHMKPLRKSWSFKLVQSEALMYQYKKDFRKNSLDAYTWAHKNKVIDIVCSHMKSGYTDLTVQKAKEEALKYKTKKDFENGSPRVYFYAHGKKIIDEICSHMDSGRGIWNLELTRQEALKYELRKDFERDSCGAYCFAYRNGYLDEVCSHMMDNVKTDNDVIYIWKALSLGKWNDKDIYKIGKTSARLGKERIYFVANQANIQVEIVLIEKVNCKASDLETEILRMGEKINLSGFNGASDFRAFSRNDLKIALEIIKPNIAKTNI